MTFLRLIFEPLYLYCLAAADMVSPQPWVPPPGWISPETRPDLYRRCDLCKTYLAWNARHCYACGRTGLGI